MKYDYNGKQSTSFDASYWKQFKIKLFTSTILTVEILKNRYPHLYNNYSWTCLNDVLRLKYGATTETIDRCQENESLEHVFFCKTGRPMITQIIKNLILRITSNLRSIHPSGINKHIICQLSNLPYFNLNTRSDCDISFTQLIQGFI